MKYNDLTWGQMEAICNKLGGDEGIAKFLRGDLILTEKFQPVFYFLIKVDRSKKPSYPEWTKKVMHPEFELSGPDEFDLQKDINLFHYGHVDDRPTGVQGPRIYDYLKKQDLLKDCLNLSDLYAIKDKGRNVYISLFKKEIVLAWKSVIENEKGDLFVPCLFVNRHGRLDVNWNMLTYFWFAGAPWPAFSNKDF